MPDEFTYFEDIVFSAELAIQYLGSISLSDFYDDLKTQDAIIRRISIMGEATRRISDAVKDKYPQIPWQKIRSMRNAIIHEYDEVDIQVVWDTVKCDLPPLVENLRKILYEN